MKTFTKTLGAVLAAGVIMMSTANAALINLGFGPTTIEAEIYLNTGVDQNGESVSQGIGRVTSIVSDAGETFNSTVESVELNFVFDNITSFFLSAPNSTNTVSFSNILGDVGFYSNSAGVFAPTGDFSVDYAAIIGGDLLISAIGHGVGNDNITTEGLSNGLSIAANGQLDVIAGSRFDNIVQDSILSFDGSLSDMTFNFSGDDQQTAGYVYSGNATFKTATVPEPSMLGLLGLGMVGMMGAGGIARKRKANTVA